MCSKFDAANDAVINCAMYDLACVSVTVTSQVTHLYPSAMVSRPHLIFHRCYQDTEVP